MRRHGRIACSPHFFHFLVYFSPSLFEVFFRLQKVTKRHKKRQKNDLQKVRRRFCLHFGIHLLRKEGRGALNKALPEGIGDLSQTLPGMSRSHICGGSFVNFSFFGTRGRQKPPTLCTQRPPICGPRRAIYEIVAKKHSTKTGPKK